MEKWETQLNLRFPGMPWKFKVGFVFEWKAWLIAYDLLKIGPEEFNALPSEQQLATITYAAAAWYRMKNGKKVFFTRDQLTAALMNASKADNLRIIHALHYAQFPDWLKAGMPEVEKKNEPET